MLFDSDKKKNTITVLDGIRGLACFLVIFFHLNLVARDYHIWVPIHDFALLLVQLHCLDSLVLFSSSCYPVFFCSCHTQNPCCWQRTGLLFVCFICDVHSVLCLRYYISLFLLTIVLHSEYLQKEHWDDLWLFITFRMDFPQTFQKINGPFWTMAIEAQCLPIATTASLGD